jgi:hypothetical protein
MKNVFGPVPQSAIAREDELNGYIYLRALSDTVITPPGRATGFTLPSGTHVLIKIRDAAKVKDGILSSVQLEPDFRRAFWGIYSRRAVQFDTEKAQRYAATHPMKPAPTASQ